MRLRARAGRHRRLRWPQSASTPAARARANQRIVGAHRGVEIDRFERDPRRQRNRRETHRGPRGGGAEAHDADPRDVAFEQRVRRLRGRVRDERDRGRIDRVLAQQPLETGDDAGGDAVGMIVRRRHFNRGDQRARRGVDGDDVGERAADIDADANLRRRRLPRG